MRFIPKDQKETLSGKLGPVKMACGCRCEDARAMIVDEHGKVWPPEGVDCVIPDNELERDVARIAGYALSD